LPQALEPATRVPEFYRMRRLRLPLLALALLFLATSLSTLLWSNLGGGSLLAYLHPKEETPEELAARDKARREADLDYIKRVRADGLARVAAGDYENGRTRLNEAARLDPEGEKSEDVLKARHSIKLAPLLGSAEGP
jgi:hypothetical protein